jgi:hypothetical protein
MVLLVEPGGGAACDDDQKHDNYSKAHCHLVLCRKKLVAAFWLLNA